MTAVLYHFLHDAGFRGTVKSEHAALAGWFGGYLHALKRVYGPEISR